MVKKILSNRKFKKITVINLTNHLKKNEGEKHGSEAMKSQPWVSEAHSSGERAQ